MSSQNCWQESQAPKWTVFGPVRSRSKLRSGRASGKLPRQRPAQCPKLPGAPAARDPVRPALPQMSLPSTCSLGQPLQVAATKQRRGHCHALPSSRTIHAISEEGDPSSSHKAQGARPCLSPPTVCTKVLAGHEGSAWPVSSSSPPDHFGSSGPLLVREIQTGKTHAPAFLSESLLSGGLIFSIAKTPQFLPKALPLPGSVHLDLGPSGIPTDMHEEPDRRLPSNPCSQLLLEGTA